MNFFTAYMKSPVGHIRIKSGGNSICEVHFLNEGEAISEQNDDSPLLQQCMLELEEYFNGERRHFDVPLQQEGTPFQQKVWSRLLTIPYGKTISYFELSKQLGDVKAIRAVGTSNGKNNIAIIVPCHRVIGSDGSLTGYAGGIWRKQWLLEHEAKIANGVQTLF